ncbi:energy-coupling factor transporter ATP-binding protein EcfA [Paenibacillus baekrokdamisoli]|uniref:Energy-coupling factor transporter ATP-binding protein EcfA n=1 Tax=Paenibacillus baekrokdamisoli TaxID=1712516 RepID=A0A3G9ITY3_9BACL|nr:ATP-binding cassette domain-containing protein [Paenibacillus baekrokdamisoli]MBB3072611.1 energy-coupling factor transport system ATP-binding protein [Paenibacillus baekrokdamisoli]BBH22337.1 energy-coupling factor transporter ATP-binding protein EcfA [Paenibacillus baekrokdamisoli]
MIRIHDVFFSYSDFEDDPRWALQNVSLDIQENEFVAFLGPNGSGKSSLSRLLNGIELPQQGSIAVDELSTEDQASIPSIRRKVQMVFQNPENQQVGFTVGEDIAFGLSNFSWPRESMPSRIQWALQTAGLNVDVDRLVSQLSGGEKQKLALAAVLAIGPEYLILDEATSMLDPSARKQFVTSLAEARRLRPFSLIYVTHHMEEVMAADRWVLFSEGRVRAIGTPEELWRKPELLQSCGLELPYLNRLALMLEQDGVHTGDMDAANLDEWGRKLCKSS